MEFGRGYDKCREKLKSCSKYLMSCFNCEYYYQAVGDLEDLCQNPDVLEYDMINTETSIYCLKWKPVKGSKKENAKRAGFRNGVGVSGYKKEKITKTRKKSSKRT